VAGHKYGFYSIARDLAGNIETSKTTAEATTLVVTLGSGAFSQPKSGRTGLLMRVAMYFW
jgi:hypothetical protein